MKKEIFPVVKWAGGKTQLLDVLLPLIPKKYNKYFEPFLGGGALLFSVQPEVAIVNDINDELMTLYKVIREDPVRLIKGLKRMVVEHNNNPEFYYKKIRCIDPQLISDFEKAERFLYLNKTGFNGLYRVNSNGEFNVPFNKKNKISITTLCSVVNLDRMSDYLKSSNVVIRKMDFEEIINESQKGDFIFVDSPYDESFASYSSLGFNKDDHKRLAESLTRASERGVRWIVTNHNTKLIKSLYKNNYFFEVPVNRYINSDAKNRLNATSEVIILNFVDEIDEFQKREFEEAKFFKQLKPTSIILRDYIKWQKIEKNINKNKMLLNDLNLLKSNDENEFEKKFDDLYMARPESFSILPLLLSSRSKDFIYWLESGEAEKFNWQDRDNVHNFLVNSGLIKNLFLNSLYNNVFDYVLGLEVGLTSNDKKNLTGQWMAAQVESIFIENNIFFEKELSYEAVVNVRRVKNKYFDYVFSVNGHTYCLEVNFFNTQGSKINSEASRFIELDKTFREYENIHFVWVTDGIGLRKSKPDVIKALRNIKYVYNLTTFKDFIQSLSAKK